MNKEKYLQLILEKGLSYGPIIKQYLIEDFADLNLPKTIENKIVKGANSKQDFEISISELKIIFLAVEKRINQLINDPNFNPFKTELRKKYPEQYGNDAFHYNGTTYYLYSKGFEIDALISSMASFRNVIENHIKLNKSLKFIYKE